MDWDNDAYDLRFSISVYDQENIFHFESESTFNNIVSVGEPEAHYFGMVPVAVFNLNEENASCFEPIISLQDAYNKLLSDEVNDFEAFVDAYMVLQNLMADADDLAAMKENRTILIDGDSDVKYLTKSTTDTQIENMLANINTSIHTISNSPDFSSQEFNSGVSSGIALQFKLLGFENIASSIEAQFRKALETRNDIINAAFGLIDGNAYAIEVTFTRNIPTAISDVVNMVNTLRGLVSDQTLLAQLPFIDDVVAEKERVANEQSISLNSIYDMGSVNHGEAKD